MRTVLIGTDLMYNSVGDLKPIEINTNLGYDYIKVELDEDVFDLTKFQEFLTENNFVKVTYIGGIGNLAKAFRDLCISLNIDFLNLQVQSGSITIPYVEDAENELIIRSAYDTTALVDDEYCKDKINFLNLIKNSDFSSQFAYMDESGNIVSNITTITDNGNHPNFILKAKYPNYDREVFPKLFKVSTQEELNSVIQNNVTNDYFLMEYYYNESKTFSGITTTIRAFHILFPPNLNSIPLGQYTKLASLRSDENDVYDLTTYELQSQDRRKYLTELKSVNTPHLLATDKVELADGTFKTAEDLQIGDVLKTIKFPLVEEGYLETIQNEDDLPALISSAVYTTNPVINKLKVDKWVWLTRLTFTDGTDWFDTDSSRYLVSTDGISVSFKWLIDNAVDGVKIGDKIVLLDTSDGVNVNYVFKEVATISTDREVFGGYQIEVEEQHLFLTSTDSGLSHVSFVAIEHNIGCDPYNQGCRIQGPCPKGQQCCPGARTCPIRTGTCSGTCVAPFNNPCC